MAGYFQFMHMYFSKVIQNKDSLKSIHITNTSNVCKQFHNIRIEIVPKTPVKYKEILHKVFSGKLSKSEQIILNEYNEWYRSLTYDFERNTSENNISCGSWETMVRNVYDIYDDFIEVFRINKINIPVTIEVLGCHEDDFYTAIDKAVFKDIKELSESPEMNSVKKEIDSYYEDTCSILYSSKRYIEGIKQQKEAYLLCKLIEGKANRKDLKHHTELIKAYDSYIDVKKLINNKPYAKIAAE